MACFGQELDGFEPFLLGRFDFLDRRMQMAGHTVHDLFEPFAFGIDVLPNNNVGGIVFGEMGNWQTF